MARISRNPRTKIKKKNPTIEEDTSNLPCEIIENILSRLPVKSLLRFKSVSKPWCSLISNSKFARVHLHQSKNSDSITLHVGFSHFNFLKFKNQNFQLESLDFPLKKYKEATVLCSCDGLVLMTNYGGNQSNKMLVLWNPSTRTYTKFSCPYSHLYSRFGLCYDESNDDYKVVLVHFDWLCAIYSYKNNSWIEKNSLLARSITQDPGLFVNGALHWVANRHRIDFDSHTIEGKPLQKLHHKPCIDCEYSPHANYLDYERDSIYKDTYEICCFNPRDDEFKKLSKPASFDIRSKFHLIDLGGKLSLYRKSHDCTKIEIWTMVEYGDCDSWTMLQTIEDLHVKYLCTFYCKPLCLTNENNIVLHIRGLGLVVYNPNTKKFDKVRVYDDGEENSDSKYMYLTPLLCWHESLLLPSRINKTKRK